MLSKREEVWMRAWVASMQYPGRLTSGSCTASADEALSAFDKRFPK